MLGIARIAELGQWLAAAMAAILFYLGVLFFEQILVFGLLVTPVVFMLSGAVVGFVILRHGEVAGVQTIAAAAVMVLALAFFAELLSLRIALMMLVVWGGALLVSAVLRHTVSLGNAILASVPFAIVAALAAVVYQQPLQAYWNAALLNSMGPLTESQKNVLSEADVQALMENMSALLAASVGNWVVVIVVCGLFFARSWQAKLFNPGGFQKEFHSLQLGKQAAVAAAISLLLAIALKGAIWIAIASVLMFVFFLQGMSVLHWLVKQRGMNQGWLVGIYILILLPQTVLLVGALGVADNLVRLRQL